MATPYMEYVLDLPLRDVLAFMQRRIKRSTYHGVPALKSPLDLWVYQEIICEVRPDVVVEIGVHAGGGTLALAHILDALGHGAVVGVDRTLAHVSPDVRGHPRILLMEGNAAALVSQIVAKVGYEKRVLVIEDSSHEYENTLRVLDAYAPLVSVGSYLIVEDGICHHGLDEGPSPGPYEAVTDWLSQHSEFAVDRGRESFLITWNPKGYLRRLR